MIDAGTVTSPALLTVGKPRTAVAADQHLHRSGRPDHAERRLRPDRRAARRQGHPRHRGQQRQRPARRHLVLARRSRRRRQLRLERQPVRHRPRRQRRQRHRHRPFRRALQEVQRHLERRERQDGLLPERNAVRPAEPGRLAQQGPCSATPATRWPTPCKKHELWGGGSYIYTNVDPSIHATRAFEVPVHAGREVPQPADRAAAGRPDRPRHQQHRCGHPGTGRRTELRGQLPGRRSSSPPRSPAPCRPAGDLHQPADHPDHAHRPDRPRPPPTDHHHRQSDRTTDHHRPPPTSPTTTTDQPRPTRRRRRPARRRATCAAAPPATASR